ncbi:MAG: D-lyxose/D-mannose family sugar isomerase [Terriglobia bacterium]|jgi:D-lyxose ketol-isomerase
MKRSEINAIMSEADQFIRRHGFYLPPFAYWTPAEWRNKGEEAREIVENQLGWDITDFGAGQFGALGLFLFTVRNGSQAEMRAKQGKLYCEKLMIVGVNQVTPMHFHWNKVEDIINRGGGKLVIQLYNANDQEGLADSTVVASLDGVKHQVTAGDVVRLAPGESITIPPRLYHKFWGAEDRVLVGEVSLVNDDQNDNRFHETIGRFPMIEEDEEPLHLLVTDYPKYWKGSGE